MIETPILAHALSNAVNTGDKARIGRCRTCRLRLGRSQVHQWSTGFCKALVQLQSGPQQSLLWPSPEAGSPVERHWAIQLRVLCLVHQRPGQRRSLSLDAEAAVRIAFKSNRSLAAIRLCTSSAKSQVLSLKCERHAVPFGETASGTLPVLIRMAARKTRRVALQCTETLLVCKSHASGAEKAGRKEVLSGRKVETHSADRSTLAPPHHLSCTLIETRRPVCACRSSRPWQQQSCLWAEATRPGRTSGGAGCKT